MFRREAASAPVIHTNPSRIHTNLSRSYFIQQPNSPGNTYNYSKLHKQLVDAKKSKDVQKICHLCSSIETFINNYSPNKTTKGVLRQKDVWRKDLISSLYFLLKLLLQKGLDTKNRDLFCKYLTMIDTNCGSMEGKQLIKQEILNDIVEWQSQVNPKQGILGADGTISFSVGATSDFVPISQSDSTESLNAGYSEIEDPYSPTHKSSPTNESSVENDVPESIIVACTPNGEAENNFQESNEIQFKTLLNEDKKKSCCRLLYDWLCCVKTSALDENEEQISSPIPTP